MSKSVIMIASGDLRESANRVCWPAQERVEAAVTGAMQQFGYTVLRAHSFVPAKGHGFIDSQKLGMQVFQNIPADAPLVVVEAVWQYSHHVLAGLTTHQGPILTVANWSGQWPGLVGMLNLNGSLTKAGVPYTTLWSEDFTDDYFTSRLSKWLRGEWVTHDQSHVRRLASIKLPRELEALGQSLAQSLHREKAIMGVFDEGCMGMFNAIIPDHLLNPTGVFKERLSQSSLYAAMRHVTDSEALKIRIWLDNKGLRFKTGPNPETDLTDEQILEQCRMYIAALRIADEFGCDTIGIQYQQGLKDLAPASDLVEGLLNNADRPPVEVDGRVLYPGEPLPHFNEVDECAGLDALVTKRVWRALGFSPETTLHDLRYGEDYKGQFVWVLEISGAVPPAHNIGGYAGSVSERQPPMYFRLGGGSLKGISKPGNIVWSRIYIEDGRLKADLGLAEAVELPQQETERRWNMTTPQWPIMHAVLHGVTRDQMMGRHKANHIQVAYAPDLEGARKALAVKAAFLGESGLEVFVCGSETGL